MKMVNVESISSLISSGVDSAAQMSIGQAILKAIDKFLWTIEKSVQWSLPSTDIRMEVNGKPSSDVDFVRPLPWILFLPTLLFLRIVRISINLTASVLGYSKVEPIDMIQVLQKSRKRIQAIKSTGMKNMKLNKGSITKDKPMTVREASKSLAKSLRLTLSTLSCLDSGTKMPPSPPPTKIRVSNFFDSVSSEAEEKPEVEIVSSTSVNDSKRKFSDICSDDSVDESDESDDEAVLDDELNGVAKMLVTNRIKHSKPINELAKPQGSMDIDKKNNQEFAESNSARRSQEEFNGSRHHKIPVKANHNSSTNSDSINSNIPENKNHSNSADNEFGCNNQKSERFDQNIDKSVPDVALNDKHLSDQKSSVPNANHNKQNNKNKIKYNRKKK